MVEMKHKVHSASEVEAVVKLAARVTTRQVALESIIDLLHTINGSATSCDNKPECDN